MILVTGATGLVGGHLMWQLLQKHECVTAIKREKSNIQGLESVFRFYTNSPDLYLKKICWVTADMLDYESLKIAIRGINTVYHCAALVNLGESGNEMHDINVLGTANLVKLCLESGVERFCFVSSVAAIGHPAYGKQATEDLIFNPKEKNSMYALSKHLSEQEVWKGIANGLNGVIVNPGVILGYSSNNTGSFKLFNLVKRGLIFYTTGNTGYVDVHDVARIMIKLTESEVKNERFILVSENMSNKDILRYIAAELGKIKPFIGLNREIMLFLGFISEKIGKILGIKPLLDRKSAKSATSTTAFSNQKIINQTGIKFTPVKDCITGVCKYLIKIDKSNLS